MSNLDGSRAVELGLRFARAAEARDADVLIKLYHPDARFWNNVLGRFSTTPEVLELARLEARLIASYSFEDLRCTPTGNGFVLQTRVTGSTRRDVVFSVDTCLVAQVEGELITRIDEYLDSTQAAPLFNELFAANAENPV